MKDLYSKVLRFLLTNRRGGTTTLLEKIANEHDVYVLCPNEKQSKNFKGKALNIDRGYYNFLGLKPKPILVETTTLAKIIGDYESRIRELKDLEKEIERRDEIITRFNREYQSFRFKDVIPFFKK